MADGYLSILREELTPPPIMHKVKEVRSLSFVETRYTETKSGCILGEKTGKRMQHLSLFTVCFWWREAGESLDNVTQVL